METQKIVSLLNSCENEFSKFAAKKWYVIHSETKGSYSHHDPIRFLTGSLESSLIILIILMHIFWLQEILLLKEEIKI